ncbi:RNA methyltransferase [Synechococcus sp. 63AY4M2]|uniref:RNA methyltransferase n=1 Tax=unclassified Synechococcus TaxID=2626047 RepID=UPI00006945E8|nr:MULTISPECIES: RNA methyltransferase [unclassified Synechococcus]ABD00098.1 RNA methyltransferase, TrmH family, group 1 [Synechococcus sp. JA-3-3Ab]PIK86999.1 RNA methyltransferase [Synechococcus sp. 63AY4M2]PIK87917.1 RNA methyltransferase [Synechococcus sp. 65AY6A5]PIK92359.1 RNA methyltransferase [Synechococcus sp. 65AY6Li]
MPASSNWAQERLAQVRLVLVRPAGPRNLGAIARVMKNMGLRQWVLVDPQCDPLDAEAVTMAVHATDLLRQARQVPTLAEALQGCVQVFGTAGRREPYPPEWQIQSPRQAFPELLAAGPAALVFGPEDRGLSNEELALCHRQIQIPTDPAYPSLNLAQAVGICCYELRTLLCQNLPPPVTSSGISKPAPFELLEGFFGHLEALLLQIGYLHPHTARRKMLKLRALFHRAGLIVSEVALLRGILRQLQWSQKSSPREPPKKEDPHPAESGS